MKPSGYFIRDTLINYEVLNSLPADRQERIKLLTVEFNGLGYIDARTAIGPDQYARMSAKQRDKLSNTTCKAFAIESEIKELLKSDDQLSREAEEAKEKAKNNRIQAIQYRIRDIESFLQRKLQSNRDNPTKKEYRELKAELQSLTN